MPCTHIASNFIVTAFNTGKLKTLDLLVTHKQTNSLTR